MFNKGSTAACAALLLALSTTAGAVSFQGANTGDIPDAPAGDPACGLDNENGTPRLVTFQVSGLTSNISTVGLTLDIQHPYRGDLVVKLLPPAGTPVKVIFAHTQSTARNGCGSPFPVDGLYRFYDTAPYRTDWTTNYTNGDFWFSTQTPTRPGDYRASQAGGDNNGGFTVPMSQGFSGLTPEQANGTWTLSVLDAGDGETGTVRAATLYINEALPVSLQQFSID
jgi:hypothetical protein